MTPIMTARTGNNTDTLSDISKLYAVPKDVIADVTYGKGAFWKNIDTTIYSFLPSDIRTGVDYNNLPYIDSSIDVVVFDPPYMGHNGGKNYSTARNYNVNVKKYDPKYIDVLYYGGIAEARRVLKHKGILILKCQDEIQSGKQNINHCKILNHCVNNGFIVEDIFIVIQKGTPVMRHSYQIHARKNHSYFIVFRKTSTL